MNLVPGTPFLDIFEKDAEREPKTGLLQGDIISVEIKKLLGREENVNGYLIISNSCDLLNNNVRKISLVPIYPLDVWFKENSSKNKNDLRKLLFDEANYGRKLTFFISPDKQLGDKPSVAYLDDIRSIGSDIIIFNWNYIPGNDNVKLINFLRNVVGINWVKNVDIEKNDAGDVICIYTTENSLFLIHRNDEPEVVLLVDDGSIRKFKATIREAELYISLDVVNMLEENRLLSLKSPWREQLGHKAGNVFNRVSTCSPIKEDVFSWADLNKDK